jgi:hypothetical protein
MVKPGSERIIFVKFSKYRNTEICFSASKHKLYVNLSVNHKIS